MNSAVEIHGKPVRIKLSHAAAAALKLRTSPLLAEMRLFFSCAARKEVRFHEADNSADQVAAAQGLMLRFSPIVTRVCTSSEAATSPQFKETHVQNPAAFVPHWVSIDYLAGEWRGKFGYD